MEDGMLKEVAGHVQVASGCQDIETTILLIPYLDRILRRDNSRAERPDFPPGYLYLYDHPVEDIKTAFTRMFQACAHLNDIFKVPDFKGDLKQFSPVISAPDVPAVEGSIESNAVEMVVLEEKPVVIAQEEDKPKDAWRRFLDDYKDAPTIAGICLAIVVAGFMTLISLFSTKAIPDSGSGTAGVAFLLALGMTICSYVFANMYEDAKYFKKKDDIWSFVFPTMSSGEFLSLFAFKTWQFEFLSLVTEIFEVNNVFLISIPICIRTMGEIIFHNSHFTFNSVVWWLAICLSFAGRMRTHMKWRKTINDSLFVNPDPFEFDTSLLYNPETGKRWGSFLWSENSVRVAYGNAYYTHNEKKFSDAEIRWWCLAPILPAEFVSSDGYISLPSGYNGTTQFKIIFWAFGTRCRNDGTNEGVYELSDTAVSSYRTLDTRGERYTLSMWNSEGPSYATTAYGKWSSHARTDYYFSSYEEINNDLGYGRIPKEYLIVDWVADLDQGVQKARKSMIVWISLAFAGFIIFPAIWKFLSS